LDWAGSWLKAAGAWFGWVADQVRGVAWIGPYFAWPFDQIEHQLDVTGGYLQDADDYVRYLKQWVDGIVNGDTFTRLLWRFIPDGQLLLYSPKSWVLLRLNQIHSELAYFASTPTQYVRWKLGTLIYKFDLLMSDPWAWAKDIAWHRFPALYPFLIDPVQASRNFLFWHFQVLYYIWQDPHGWLRNAFSNLFPDLYALANDPWYWLRVKLQQVFPIVYPFLMDPDGWIKERIRVLLGLPPGFWNRPIYTLVDLLLQELEQVLVSFADRIARIAVAVIIHFM
jgi:hypothetical protein